MQYMKCRFYLSLLFFCLYSLQCKAGTEIWLLIDTKEHHLAVMEGERVKLTFENIATGRYGASKTRMKGDNQTPIGTFRIAWISQKHQYYKFFGLDFPAQEMADIALREEKISEETWLEITRALNSRKLPPQDTALGGYIGIHGIGRGNKSIHNEFNWTNGCIALTNAQIDVLSAWVYIGMKVTIQ